jgi:PTH1 family peptidyl-tRNA hydrolase
MWLIAGLGNPGPEYDGTRHNAGFMVIDILSQRHSIRLERRNELYMYGRGFMEDEEVILLKPLTYMNRSGLAVRDIVWRHEDVGEVLVIHDDLDIEPGLIRIRRNGSSGGHNGVQSIIDMLGSKDFLRLKVGIGRPSRMIPEHYVLRPFAKKEREVIDEALEKAADAAGVIISEGVSRAQNIYHRD